MKINFKSFCSIALIATAMTMAGCASPELLQNSKYTDKVMVSSKNPVLLFPMSLHGTPGDDTEVGLAISAGVVGKYGTAVISGQQLRSVVGNLSWSLGEGMRRNANNGSFTLSGSSAKTAADLKSALSKLTAGLKKAGAVDANFEFKYIIALHVDSAGGISIPFIRKVTAFGGILDINTLDIITYIEKDITLADDSAAVLGQMPTEMNSIIDELVWTAESKAKADEEANAE